MIAATDAFALLGWALASCAAALRLQRFGFSSAVLAKALTLTLFVGLLIPIFGAGLPLAAFFRGVGGDLSITLLILSAFHLSHRLFDTATVNPREWSLLMAIASVAALFLYPTALGLGDWDAYRLGWGSWWFLSALLALCAFSALRGYRAVPAIVALAVSAWSFSLLESSNLWDYLLDPWLCVYALGFAVLKCGKLFLTQFVDRSAR